MDQARSSVTDGNEVSAKRNAISAADRKRPAILFLCVHNAGRSQMAAAFAQEMAGEDVDVFSAGSEPAGQINPAVVAAMREVGIDLASRKPRKVQDKDFEIADVVVTMGCGDACIYYPGKRYEDWDIPDPSTASMDEIREIRDEIKRRVAHLLSSLGVSVKAR
jgi:protein-tyrosine-phosphatase